jgi:hypothetical protein
VIEFDASADHDPGPGELSHKNLFLGWSIYVWLCKQPPNPSEEKQPAMFHGYKPCYCHPGKKS